MANRQGEGKIDWCNFTWNPVSGVCFLDCHYCYMKAIRKRFPALDHPPVMNEKELAWNPPEDAKVFVCSTLDLFHYKMKASWVEMILDRVRENPQAIYQFLTKLPAFYDRFDFPDNCWLGTTVDGLAGTDNNIRQLLKAVPKRYKRFISYEPLLRIPPVWFHRDSWNGMTIRQYGSGGKPDWIIIGADSRRGARKPPRTWSDRLIREAREDDIAVWVKDNLKHPVRIKEWPMERTM